MHRRDTIPVSHPRFLLVPIVALAIVALFLVPSGSLGSTVLAASRTTHSLAGTSAHMVDGPPALKVAKSSQYDWPEFHQSPLLNGYSSSASPLTSLNASLLGVAWATNAYGAILDSPAVAYDPTLGETLVYVGTETGNVVAVNLANGMIVWGDWFGSAVRSSPLVNNGSVFIVPFLNAEMFKLSASTGAIQCTTLLPGDSEATPTVATPPGGVTSVYIGTAGSGPVNGPFLAINAGNCSIEWKFSGYHHAAGSWAPASYVVNATGVPVVLFGTDDPDSSIYAVNALTGHLYWRFQCYNPGVADDDVASGVAISPPGKNGFAQGVAYAINKAGRTYALDLNNGTLIWETNFNALAGQNGTSRSTAALDGTSLVFGFISGMFNLNATTGAVSWMYRDSSRTESIASPALAGGHGHGVAVTGDVGGALDVVSMVGGSQLYSYPTGGYITSSPALSNGNILIGSSVGYLYDFDVGGGNHATLPTTSLSYPVPGTTVPNPNGNLTVRGNATDPSAVTAVNVAIRSNGVSGPWWDAATRTWSPGPVDNHARLGTPGGTSTSWNFSFPAARSGGAYEVFAYAVSSSGQSDLSGAESSFAVAFSTSGPHLETSTRFVAPGGSVNLSGGGFGASEKVQLSIFGTAVSTVTSTANGTVRSTRVSIPSGTTFGLTTFTALGQTSGWTSTAAVTVANSWSQFGNGPGHFGLEPNDPTLNNVIFPGANQWVLPAWHFDAGVPIDSSPAVVDGRAYAGDTIGNFYAIDTTNGDMLWNFTLASAAAIDGSPAVDATLGLVVFGANDGTLEAVNLTHGTLVWSTLVGGNLSAPVLNAGHLYVTSNRDTVEEVVESTGSPVWTTTLSSNITSAPALNATANLLVVGETNGQVVGLFANNGTTRWTYTTGGAVRASATVNGRLVYVGSDDRNVYALNQTTGAKVWSFRTHGAVEDTGALLDKETVGRVLDLYIGSNDGKLYALNALTGFEYYNVTAGTHVVGVATMRGVAVFETSGGTVSGTRAYVATDGWRFSTGGPLVTAPVLIDGTIYVGSGSGFLYAFTYGGRPPV